MKPDKYAQAREDSMKIRRRITQKAWYELNKERLRAKSLERYHENKNNKILARPAENQ